MVSLILDSFLECNQEIQDAMPKNKESRQRILAAALALKKLPPAKGLEIMNASFKRRGFILDEPKTPDDTIRFVDEKD